MWQFKEATAGLADGCLELGIPVTGGNVSFYNQTGDTAIYPTPVVGVLGVIDNVARRIPSGWQDEGNNIYLLGTTRDELDGSAWAEVIHDHLGGKPPVVDLNQEKALAELVQGASLQGLIASAHDLSDGGLTQAIVESCLRFNVGARIWLEELMERDQIDLTAALFSESQGRMLISVGREDDVKFVGLCEARNIPVLRIGVTDTTGELVIQDVASWEIRALESSSSSTLPGLFKS
jgi:phosphoribosylformylglycinamidine (FGAM) synthase-like enzyme